MKTQFQILPILLFIVLLAITSGCNSDNILPNLDEQQQDKVNLIPTVHIYSADLDSVNGRWSYWTIEINYDDSANQYGTCTLEATIENIAGTITVFNVHGETIEYYGPFNNTKVEYEVDYYLPCDFSASTNYKYWIDYYDSEGEWIDSYPNRYPNTPPAETFWQNAKKYPCYE